MAYECKNNTFTKITYNTPFSNRIELTICTLCAFRVLNPRQCSLAKQCNLKKLISDAPTYLNMLKPKGMVL